MPKDLHTLIRLHQYRVDEKRRSLGELLGEVANLEQQSDQLEKQMIIEQEVANSAPDTVGMFYGEYATSAVNKRGVLAEEIGGVEQRIAVAQEEMRAEFKDMKVYEISQAKRDEIATLDANRQEQAILDELGQEAHRRRRIKEI